MTPPTPLLKFRAGAWLLLLVAMIPVLLFYTVIWQQAVNVPLQDDYDALFEPVMALSHGPYSLAQVWKAYAAQDDERRIIVDRFVAHMHYLLTGHIDFRTQILIGSLVLLVVLAVFIAWFRRSKLPWIWTLPIPFVLFNMQYYDAVLWSMIPLQHIGVYVWALLAIWWLSRDTSRLFWLATVAAIISLFSDVTGVLILPVGALMLIATKRWQRLGIWLVIMGGLVAFYMHGLVVPSYRPSLSDNLHHPLTIAALWLAMQGLWADVLPHAGLPGRLVLTITLGLVAVGIWSSSLWNSVRTYVFTRQQPEGQELFLYGGLLMLLGTFTLFATGRALEGVDAAFISRYRVLYLLWFILLYLLILSRLNTKLTTNRLVSGGVVALSLLYCLTTYFQYWNDLTLFRHTLLTDLYGWRYNRVLPSSPIYLDHRPAIDTLFENGMKRGIFRYENPDIDSLRTALVVGQAEVVVNQLPTFISITVPRIPGGEAAAVPDAVFILLRTKTGAVHIFPTKATTYSPLMALRRQQYTTSPYASIPILRKYLRSSVYNVEVGVWRGKDKVRYQTPAVISF
ncbi:hypothetical protein J2I47_16395 [Fibrella sp. HMF5335]|uniref:Uncharacterized protein n=1 Tax=Fibrella rubiginis TaxID=2817060 RepID=A0A939GKK9_9BACT|nr:hypothetical protein [Fibrella rubiginis]MBO0938133.1 hypothetical protein [Fibrella rubiginis]